MVYYHTWLTQNNFWLLSFTFVRSVFFLIYFIYINITHTPILTQILITFDMLSQNLYQRYFLQLTRSTVSEHIKLFHHMYSVKCPLKCFQLTIWITIDQMQILDAPMNNLSSNGCLMLFLNNSLLGRRPASHLLWWLKENKIHLNQ